MTSTNLDLAVLLLSIVLPLMVALARFVMELLLERLPAARRARLETLVGTVVHAVEQANAGMAGPEKKRVATQLITQLAKDASLTISPTQLDVLLEAAVHALNLSLSAASTTSTTSTTR
ncbi:MAG TPA: phage holin, LLH family [Ktedonobacterales bacterium]|nr:phage holin, LLH family [Ktedonobacterales bacterium]